MMCCMCGEPIDDGRAIIFREDGEVRCGILSDCYQRPTLQVVARPIEATAAANARLIAAAPALYEALRRVNGALRVIREHMDSTGKELSPVFDLADADTLLDVTKAALLLANTGETENG